MDAQKFLQCKCCAANVLRGIRTDGESRWMTLRMKNLHFREATITIRRNLRKVLKHKASKYYYTR